MKGTEVPIPRRSSACDCTCVLTRKRSLSCDSLILAMRIVLIVSACAKFAHEFQTLFDRPCATQRGDPITQHSHQPATHTLNLHSVPSAETPTVTLAAHARRGITNMTAKKKKKT